jgi:hypothetical protein
MKKLTDAQIQAMLESDLKQSENILSISDKEQMESYQSLFQILNSGPQEGLPFNFSSKVTRQLKLKVKRRSDIRFNLLAALGIMAGLALAYGILMIIDFNAGNLFLLVTLKYKWLLVFSSIIVLSTLIFDQKTMEEA